MSGPTFADLDPVRTLRAVTTNEGTAVPAETLGTVVSVYAAGDAYEVDFEAGRAVVDAADLASAESAAATSPCDAWVPGGDWTPNAETLAALADAEAGRTTVVTIEELRAELLADDEIDGDVR